MLNVAKLHLPSFPALQYSLGQWATTQGAAYIGMRLNPMGVQTYKG